MKTRDAPERKDADRQSPGQSRESEMQREHARTAFPGKRTVCWRNVVRARTTPMKRRSARWPVMGPVMSSPMLLPLPAPPSTKSNWWNLTNRIANTSAFLSVCVRAPSMCVCVFHHFTVLAMRKEEIKKKRIYKHEHGRCYAITLVYFIENVDVRVCVCLFHQLTVLA